MSEVPEVRSTRPRISPPNCNQAGSFSTGDQSAKDLEAGALDPPASEEEPSLTCIEAASTGTKGTVRSAAIEETRFQFMAQLSAGPN